jgi:hypothetical protein
MGVYFLDPLEYTGDFGDCFARFRAPPGTTCVQLTYVIRDNYYILGTLAGQNVSLPDCGGTYARRICTEGNETEIIARVDIPTPPHPTLGPQDLRIGYPVPEARIELPYCGLDGWVIPAKVCVSADVCAYGEFPNGMQNHDPCPVLADIVPPYYVDWQFVQYKYDMCIEWVLP